MTTHTVVRLVAAGVVVVLGLLIALIVSVPDEPAGAYHCDPWEPWCYHYPTATPTPVPPTATNTPMPKPPTPTPTPRPRASLSVYPTVVNVNQSFSARAYGAVPSSLLLKLRLTGPLTSRPCDTSQSAAASSGGGATAPFTVTLRGCSPGTGTVKLLTYSTNVVLASRTVMVSGPTPTPTDTPVPTPTDTPVPAPTDTPVPTPTDTPVPTPTDTPVPTPTDTPVPTPTDTPVPTPTDTPVPPSADADALGKAKCEADGAGGGHGVHCGGLRRGPGRYAVEAYRVGSPDHGSLWETRGSGEERDRAVVGDGERVQCRKWGGEGPESLRQSSAEECDGEGGAQADADTRRHPDTDADGHAQTW